MLTTNYGLKQRSKQESKVYMESKVEFQLLWDSGLGYWRERRVRGLFIELVCFFAFAIIVAGGNVSRKGTFVIITLIPKMR